MRLSRSREKNLDICLSLVAKVTWTAVAVRKDEMSSQVLQIGGRKIGPDYPPMVIAEIGINHEGCEDKATKMIEAASRAGCECVKFQTHIIEDEMIYNDVVPDNADETIWEIMTRCALSAEAEGRLKAFTESMDMIFLSTPFSRAGADRLNDLGVEAFKIGSGECNNYPLVRHIASFGKPIIMSTGMNNIESVRMSVDIIRGYDISFALLHCTSIYPTPYGLVRLNAMTEMAGTFPDAIVGLSDHSLSNYPCLGAVALGASILERHFTYDKSWPGPDIVNSMDPKELFELIEGSSAIYKSRGGSKIILEEEQPTIDFAYASVVTISDIKPGEIFGLDNIWVKRPGTGEIHASEFERVLGRKSNRSLPKDRQVAWKDVG